MRAFLYPGQGSQKPGMGKDFYYASPAAREVFDIAEEQLGSGFISTLFEGSGEQVNDTRFAQPALLTVEVAITRHLLANGHAPAACAGHSLGEYSALVGAGGIGFAEALALVRERARLMSENVPAGGMAAVMGITPDEIEKALPGGVQVANYNTPQQTIISGSVEGLAAAQESLKAAGAKRVMPLAVSGPFHSEYMRPAAEQFAALLADYELSAPVCTFVSSVSGKPEDDPARIRTLLAEQLYSPVRWIDVMDALTGACIEVGPGNVLAGLAKRIEGAPEVVPVGSVEEAGALNA
jgi:[acyl-carrier-protein] S-malonyltransferase